MMSHEAVVGTDQFTPLPVLIQDHARRHPDKTAVTDATAQLTYAELDRRMDQVAASLQRDGVTHGQTVAFVSSLSMEQFVLFFGALRAGCVTALIQPSASPDQIAGMIADANAAITFVDDATDRALIGHALSGPRIRAEDVSTWLVPEGARPAAVEIRPEDGFNIIYSSGTTGLPKGIMLTHQMRWQQFRATAILEFGDAVTFVATPLYSNTTLTVLLPTMGAGGTVLFMKKFDAAGYLEQAQRHRATHTMLVPVQYQRIMAVPDFDRFDLSSFRVKVCTSAPFKADLKADILARWPGALIEFYGMTEGGGTAVLYADQFPDKLHTVGQPAIGHDIRLIDDEGKEVPAGEMGEVVGRSDLMMKGYHGRERETSDATWISPEGHSFIRHGDIGRFDEDGFLILMDRKKDMIISGGFNVYPSDLEEVLGEHEAVAECAVVGLPSEQWGETPVGFYVPTAGAGAGSADVLADTNAKLGKTQRLSAVYPIAELPRSVIGKVLKRELRDRLSAGEFG